MIERVCTFVIAVYVSFPVLLYLFPWILGHLVYAHLVRYPFFVDLKRPEDLLNHTRNFYLDTEEGVSVGVWHTLPAGRYDDAAEKTAEWYEDTLGDGHPIIIYLHGNFGTRAINHRVQLVKILSAAGYHVFSLDYRGFGDSSGEPSEAGLTHDALFLYHWVKKRSGESLVCLWGHSLGTGVATNSAVKIQEEGSAVDALILEAPYTSIRDVVTAHHVAKLYTRLPGTKRLLLDILEWNNIVFANDENLKILSRPVLILHADDDNIVPSRMGSKLYEISLDARRELHADFPVERIPYGATLGYSHNNIYLDPNLPDIVRTFLQKLRQ